MSIYIYEAAYKRLKIKFSDDEICDVLEKFFDTDNNPIVYNIDSSNIEETLAEDESTTEERVLHKLKNGEALELTAKERQVLQTLKRLADKRGGCFDVVVC